jgi:hypothetical protein
MVIGSLPPQTRCVAHDVEMKMSTRLSLLEMKRTTRVLEATLSRTKWKSISMCLVWAWNVGLVDK